MRNFKMLTLNFVYSCLFLCVFTCFFTSYLIFTFHLVFRGNEKWEAYICVICYLRYMCFSFPLRGAPHSCYTLPAPRLSHLPSPHSLFIYLYLSVSGFSDPPLPTLHTFNRHSSLCFSSCTSCPLLSFIMADKTFPFVHFLISSDLFTCLFVFKVRKEHQFPSFLLLSSFK